MMKRLSVLTILMGALVLTHCSKSSPRGDNVIATMDGAEVTVEDLFSRYPQERLAQAADDEIKNAVDDVVRRALFVKDAIAMGYKDSVGTKAQIQSVEDQRLFQYVYEKDILDSVINEAQLREMYDKARYEIHARHILVQHRDVPRAEASRSKEEALALCAHILQQLKEGAAFEALANQYTEDPSGKNSGGDLGWFGWGKMVGPFQETAFKLSVGEVSDVVETQFGYHIIKVEGRRETDVKPFEEEKDRLKRLAARDKAKVLQQLAQEFIFNIKANKNFQIINKNVDALYGVINASKYKVGPIDYVLKNVNFAAPLFTLDGETYGSQWIIDEVNKLDVNAKPTVNNINDFKTLLENMVVHALIIDYGYEKGYHKDAAFSKAITDVQNNIIYNNYVRDQVNANLNPSEKELLEYYENHKNTDYMQKEMVRVREVLVKDQTKADSLYKIIRDGADLGLMARRHTERKYAKERGGELAPFPPGRYGEMGRRAFEMSAGELSEPIKTNTGYSIIKVLEKIEAGHQDYERVKNRVKNDINQEMRKKRTDERFNMLTEKYDLQINYDAAYDAYRDGNNN
ncbi:MAG: peptidylprolyl isomerase [Lentisphaeria bacterium]|nr:peptidylprolyl isomerase [Candidatus Neomarinimicrobiota bacterium]MCF7841289.1 peptidylprolyl isomerase [Lentisphaeria bacterium]